MFFNLGHANHWALYIERIVLSWVEMAPKTEHLVLLAGLGLEYRVGVFFFFFDLSWCVIGICFIVGYQGSMELVRYRILESLLSIKTGSPRGGRT